MLSKTIVKYIQSLHLKKYRDEHEVFIAEGPKVVGDLLTSKRFECKMICAVEDWLSGNQELLAPVSTQNKMMINEFELEKISLLQTSNKVLAVFNKGENKIADLKNNFSLMLDGIQDPGNLGTIIRTADWFGMKNIICSEDCVDCYNPKVVQSSMGSLGRVNIVYADLEKFINTDTDVNIYAAALSGISLYEFDKIAEGIILIGNESKGIGEKLLKCVTKQVTIPKFGEAESLNAAVAAGIILSHILSK
jgi:TrmH family RNA methyltransferase